VPIESALDVASFMVVGSKEPCVVCILLETSMTGYSGVDVPSQL
jgi:hypothetical protein